MELSDPLRHDGVVRRTALTLILIVSSLLVAGPAADVATAARAPDGYRATISPIPDSVRQRMTGSSWRPGCPVKLRDLRLVRLVHLNFHGNAVWGKLVVHRWFADDIARAFRRVYEAGFKIRRNARQTRSPWAIIPLRVGVRSTKSAPFGGDTPQLPT